MSYSKIEVVYTTDGINTKANVNTRQGEKHKTVVLSKKVRDYGDRYGYYSMSIDFIYDHLIIRGGGEVLMDIDINGANNNEYIRSIVSYDWLY